jgi:ribosomal protein S18 acetylase RimI-like enzyme
VVDLRTIPSRDLTGLWQRETRWWREQLCWDVSGSLAALQRVIARGGVPGKAVQVAAQTVGYAYYVVVGGLGVISSVQVQPAWSNLEVGEALLRETVAAIRQHRVARIESPTIAIDCPWLVPVLAAQGFRTYWREFLRLDLHTPLDPMLPAPTLTQVEPWQDAHAREAAVIMQAAYADSVDGEINALYRSVADCQMVIDHTLHQGGCGRLLASASALVRHRGQGVGFILVTEIAPRHSHLVQVAVLPAYQQQGVGRQLIQHSMSRLAVLSYDTFSLIVSRDNIRAFKIYQAFGLRPVLSFPVFVGS